MNRSTRLYDTSARIVIGWFSALVKWQSSRGRVCSRLGLTGATSRFFVVAHAPSTCLLRQRSVVEAGNGRGVRKFEIGDFAPPVAFLGRSFPSHGIINTIARGR